MRRPPNQYVVCANLQSTVHSEMGPCLHCKNIGRTLEQTQNVGFATTFEIFCKPCVSDREKDCLQIVYLNEKLKNMSTVTKSERSEHTCSRLKRNRKQKRWDEKYIPIRRKRTIRPTYNKKFSKRQHLREFAKGKGSIVDFEINIRAMMAAFYYGTGAADIAKNNAFMGVPGCKS